MDTSIAFWAAILGATVGGIASYLVNMRMLRRKARVDVLTTLHYFESSMRDERYFEEIDTFIDQAGMLTRHSVIAGRREYRLAIDLCFLALEVKDQLRRESTSLRDERIPAKEKLFELHKRALSQRSWLEFCAHALP